MRRSTWLVLAGLVVFGGGTVVGASEVITLAPSQTGLDFEAGEDPIIHLQVSEVRLDRVEIAGADWAVVQVPGGHNLMERGLPSLPYLSREYLLDRTGGITLELVNTKLREIDLQSHGLTGVAPSKGHFDRTTDPASVPWVFDDKVYQNAARFPVEDVWVDRPYIAGPIRGSALRFPTAYWRPETNTLVVVEEAWFRVVATSAAENPRLGPDRPLSGLFDSVARMQSINYESYRGRTLPFAETGRLLIIADDDFVDEVAPLAEWETLVGYPTTVVPTSVTGTDNTSIKAFIQSVYDEPEGLAWIILVGDSPQIPTLTGVNGQHSPCDACYTKLEGDDNRADAAISRISAANGNQVTVQVAKILGYEQAPDTGSAGAWYPKGFGIGSDDDGDTGLADWERIELLRLDLVDPAYTYTEFDQIYHTSATAGQVSTAVNEGRSLGLYIGHGWSGGWVTTGFDTTDAHNLTNSEMLPTIWSVACNNGEFTLNECFAEAWLRSDAGGAVSFEGGTTTESWVPPCDAQRGIVDAVRLETAFTTGGQHMTGKQVVMDSWGDDNSSEGNKWVEQSVLFGSCTTWMRTQPAIAPDEPDDFTVLGGTVTLTVKVGGAPFTKAGGAIVSFYDDAGGLNVLASGLIDANGVVTAAVSGDPTHCHIHGFNLVPTSFELMTQGDSIFLDNFETGDCGMWNTVVGEK
jgi:Peptidase family C25/Propeptide_C25